MTVMRLYKYATGDIIPEGAIFQHVMIEEVQVFGELSPPRRLVWHYYLVPVDEKTEDTP